MLLAIDIGNSAIKFGVFEGDELVTTFRIPTGDNCSIDTLSESVGDQLSFQITAAFACSVVPGFKNSISDFVHSRFGVRTTFVDNWFDFGLTLRYETVGTLGTDRLVNAFAASTKYGTPVIVCSFGTATTIDAVGERNEYLGGIIAPGFESMANVLHDKTAKLPRVEIEAPETLIGRSTLTSIRSGIFYSQVGLVETVTREMKNEIGERAKVVATGGFAAMIAERCGSIDVVERDLILTGLNMLYSRLAGTPADNANGEIS